MYNLRVLKPVLEGYASKVEIKKEAEEAYINRIQEVLRKSNFGKGGCTNVRRLPCSRALPLAHFELQWYTRREGRWNATMYPWSQFHFYYSCKFVKNKDWITTASPLAMQASCFSDGFWSSILAGSRYIWRS
jgi:hypothetical protein